MSKRAELTEAIKRMTSLKKYCLENGIPAFFTIMDDDDNNKYYSCAVTPTVLRRPVEEPDKITKFNAAMNNKFYVKVTKNREEEMAEMLDDFFE